MLKSCQLLLVSIFFFFVTFVPALNAASLDYSPLNPDNSDLSPKISSPEQYLGYPLGQWHLRHDQINGYMQLVASQSPKIIIEDTGKSHQARRQLTAVISSTKNLSDIDKILNERAKVKQQKQQSGPLIIWLAYSIHGDEASGSHAALALIHYLTASDDLWVRKLLDETVVLVTPSQNPDGMDRFATWVNDNHSVTKVLDPQTREHHQNWPKGRGNHYMADLNRDWLFLRHKASQGRVALFHKWQPHYVGDFHEMGSNASYFFQPGVRSRTNPLTPDKNIALTEKLASFHQEALDRQGQTYFSGQVFDDFFYGKGSTYPDINGAIGILFEQASARGQFVATDNGELSLSTAIKNQFATSISSLKGSLALKPELMDYQQGFFNQKHKKSNKKRHSGYLVQSAFDTSRIDELANLLDQHKIQSYYLKQPVEKERVFHPATSLFIPLDQAQHSLILALFDDRKEFEDNTFYDISSWDLSSAFNLQIARKIKLKQSLLTLNRPNFKAGKIDSASQTILVDWRQDTATPMLQKLLEAGIRVKYALKPFTIKSQGIAQSWPAGTLQVPLLNQSLPQAELLSKVSALSQQFSVNISGIQTSNSIEGSDLGSFDFQLIKPVRPLLIAGRGTNASEVGEIKYYIDTRLGMPLSLVEGDKLADIDLSRYSHILFAGGNYHHFDEVIARKLGQFVTKGGIIIAQKGSLSWLSKRHILRSDIKQQRYFKQLFNGQNLSYDQQDKFNARQQIGGAIVKLRLDLSHPLNLGITNPNFAIMKDKALSIAHIGEAFLTAAKYDNDVLKSGYLASEYQREFPQSPAIILEQKGKGAVIGFADNLLFRSFWLGGEKLYANALFFGQQ